jgi:hypothetical protein
MQATAAKYLHITEGTIMDTMGEQDELSTYNGIDAQRSVIRQSLDEIAAEVGTALRNAGLTFPVYITVRNSGDSLATIATPLDPSDGDWSRAAAIICRIVGQKIGSDSLRGRELSCAVANSAPMSAAEVTAS